MQTVTPLFLETLTTSHAMVANVEAFYAGSSTVLDLPFTDGSVTVDRKSKTRRSLSLTVADPSYLPWAELDPLAVYGQQLVVSRGIRYPNGTTEVVPLGTFRIDEPQGDVRMGPVTLTGKSMECALIDDKFEVPTSTRGLSNCVDAMTFLIQQTLPTAAIVNLTAGARNPSCAIVTWDAGADRWDAVTQIATSMQAEIYVDALNRFVIVDIPNVLSSPAAWDVAEGEGGALISSGRQMSRTAVYNAVVASGENTAGTTPPVSAVARDTDPSSPTRWGGPFGKVTKRISSGLWTTVSACTAAANSALFDAIAPNVQTSVDSLPNPALEAGDVIRVTHVGRKELYLLQSLTIPLTATGDFSMSLQGGKEDTS
ncbi:DUF5047 domain-containing protein [Streptomyces sp. CA-135486]|uniref:DUF5047 domain-containing protein n=1 Tax=Streptomyces sp. CA-135486 TaxID=3240049 RepID=UPI003D8F76EB